MNGFIYLLEGPKKYVGQSVDPDRRWRDHKRFAKNFANQCSVLGKAINEHGGDKFSMIMLWEGPTEELNVMETHFIQMYDTLVPNGYNMQPVGNVQHEPRSQRERSILQKLKYIQETKGGFVVKKPGNRIRHFIAKNRDVQANYARAVDYLENIEEYATAERRDIRKLRDGYRVRVEGHKNKHFVAASKSDEEKHQQALDYLHDLLDGKIAPREFPHVQGICKHRGGFRVQVPGHAWKSFDSVKRTPRENYDLAVEYLTKLLAGEVEPETPKERAFPQVQGVSNHRAGFRVKKPGHAVKCFESVKKTKEENYNLAVEYANSLE